MPTRKILFVYAGDSGALNTLLHIAHKAVSPKTYPCNLCGLTYNFLSENGQWKQFKSTLDAPLQFLHRDEFKRDYPDLDFELPVILAEQTETFSVLVSAPEINACQTTDQLIGVVRTKLG